MQADVQQRGCRQAGGVALRTQDHPFDVVADGFRQPGVAGRVATPFQDIAFDHQRARHLTLAESLRLRPDVDEHRPAPQRIGHLGGSRAGDSGAGRISRPRRYGSSRPFWLVGQFGALAAQCVAFR